VLDVLNVGLAAGVAIGLGTAWRAGRTDLATALAAAGRGTAAPSRARAALVAVQAALSIVLLIGTGLFLLSVRRVDQLPLGFNPHDALFATMNLAGAGFSAGQTHQLFREMEARLQATPGIDHAATAVTVPYWSTWGTPVAPGGREVRPDDRAPWLSAVSPSFFATMGTRIVRGRGFTEADSRSAPPVIVINEALARFYWPDREALGQCLRLALAGPACAQIVGIAEHVVQEKITGGDRTWEEQVYLPIEQAPAIMSARVLVARASSMRRSAAVDLMRRTMETTAPGLAAANVRAFSEIPDLSAEMRPWRLGSTMFATFGTLALALAAIGLYGLMSFSVSQRFREFGLRMALGAERRHILALVLRRGVAPAAAGGAAGIVAVLLAAPAIEPLLFRTSPREPLVVGAVIAILLITALAGSLLPALRATRVDPARTLRAE
jgi:predicted permease